MSKTICQSVNSTITSTANTTEYWKIAGTFIKETTEANAQITFRVAGVFSNLWTAISQNSIALNSNMNFRNNAGNGSQSVVITALTAGEYEDTTHTDTVAAGDKVNVSTVPGAVTGTLGVQIISVIFAATTNTATKLASSDFAYASASTSTFTALQASPGVTTTEANCKCRMRKAGSFKNLQINVSANRATSTTIKMRKNGADGTLTFAITAGAGGVGITEDTTHTDTVTAGEDWNYVITSGTGVDTLTVKSLSCDFVSTAGDGLCIASDSFAGASVADNTNKRFPVSAPLTFFDSSVDTVCDIKARAAFVCSELNTLVTANDVGSASTMVLRNNAASSALTQSITANTTGVFADSTHTVTLATTDKINYELIVPSVSGSHAVVIRTFIMSTHIDQSTDFPISISPGAVSVSSSVARLKAGIEAVSETTSVSASVARVANKPRAVSTQTTTIDSSVVRVKGFPRTISETAVVIDSSVSRLATKFRALSETTVISDSLARIASKFRAVSTQTVVISDSVSRVANKLRALSETTVISASVARLRNVPRTISQTVVISDTLSRIANKFRTAGVTTFYYIPTGGDSSATLGAGTGVVRYGIELNGAGGLLVGKSISTFTASLLKGGSPTGNVTATVRRSSDDTVVASFQEAVAATSLTTSFALYKFTLASPYTLVNGDRILIEYGGAASITIEVYATDQFDGSVTRRTRFTTVYSSSSTADIVGTVALETPNTVVISDSVARLRNVPRAISNTVVISDAVARLASKFRALSETTVISDSISRLASKFRALSETTVISASVARLASKFRALSETTVISASVVRLASKFRALSETTVISDSVARLRNVPRTLSNTVVISDSVVRLASKFRALSETTVISDSVTRLRNVPRTLSNTVVISDSVVRLASKFRALSETTVISASVARLANKFRAISATATSISASISRLKTANRQAGEFVYDEPSSTYSLTVDDTLSPNSLWRMKYHGINPQNGSDLGQTGVRVPSDTFSYVFYLYPYSNTNTGSSSSASLLLSESVYYTNFDITFYVRTKAQKKSSPNAWETAWLFFRFNEADGNNFHHYYLAFKTNQTEFGRKDNITQTEHQNFLFTGGTAYTIGTWYKIRLRAIYNHFTMWKNDVQVFDVFDDGTNIDFQDVNPFPAPSAAMYQGKFGLYNEDAEVEFSGIILTQHETIATSDSVSRLRNVPRTLSNTVVISDSIVRLASKFRSISNTVVISDSIVRLSSKFRSISNTVIVSDSVSRLASKFRALSETIVISDVVDILRNVPRAISETTVISDSVSRLASKFRSLSNTVVISDSIASLRNVPRTISNTVVISDSVVRLAQKFISIPQTIIISDVVSSGSVVIRNIATQTTVISDSIIRIANKFRSISQTVISSDSANIGGTSIARDASESVSVSSSISNAAQYFRSISDNVSILDSLIRMVQGIGKSGSHMRLRFM